MIESSSNSSNSKHLSNTHIIVEPSNAQRQNRKSSNLLFLFLLLLLFISNVDCSLTTSTSTMNTKTILSSIELSSASISNEETSNSKSSTTIKRMDDNIPMHCGDLYHCDKCLNYHPLCFWCLNGDETYVFFENDFFLSSIVYCLMKEWFFIKSLVFLEEIVFIMNQLNVF
jgi:hypothetical protein